MLICSKDKFTVCDFRKKKKQAFHTSVTTTIYATQLRQKNITSVAG